MTIYSRDMARRRRQSRDRARDMRDSRRGYGSRRDSRPGEWEAEMRGEYGRDGRRGVKGTGRYGIGGSRYYGRRRDRAGYDEDMYMQDSARDYGYDEDDYYLDGRDYAMDKEGLTEEEMTEWKHALKNSDGTHGEHFTKDKILDTAKRLNVTFDDYNEKELCLVANVLYSDYGHALKAYIPIDKEVVAYTKMARAFLDDEDSAVMGSEKLALYFEEFVAPELE